MCLKRCWSNLILDTPDCFLPVGFIPVECQGGIPSVSPREWFLPGGSHPPSNGGLDRKKKVTKAMCVRSALLQLPGAADTASDSQAAASSDTVQCQDLTVHYIFTIRRQKESHLQMQTMQSLKKSSFFFSSQALCKLNDLKLPLDQRHPQWLYPAVPSQPKPYSQS